MNLALTETVLGKQATPQTSRILFEFLPGKRASEWTGSEVIQDGNPAWIKHMMMHVGVQFSPQDADTLAGNGNLDALRFLHKNGIRCTGAGADRAVQNGEYEVLNFLHDNGIYCTNAELLHISIKYFLARHIKKMPRYNPYPDPYMS